MAAGIQPLEIAKMAGHAKVTTSLTVNAHLFEEGHADAMAALGAMGQPATPPRQADNAVQLRSTR